MNTIALTVTVNFLFDVEAMQKRENDLEEILSQAPPALHNEIRREHAALTAEEHQAMNINGAISATLLHLHNASGETLPMLVDGADFFIENGRPDAILSVHVAVEDAA